MGFPLPNNYSHPCIKLDTRDWMNQFVRNLFDNSMVENKDNNNILGICQKRRNTFNACRHMTLGQ